MLNLKAMYEFKDDIPKDTVIVKTREGLDEETTNDIKFGMMQFVQDSTVIVSDKFSLNVFFDGITMPFLAYTYFVALMILLLSFFMMIVSFSQKMRDLEWEQGVLRAIGLTETQGKKIFYYETICIITTSFAAGISVGMFATLLTSALFSMMTELPLSTVIPGTLLIFILIVIAVATFIAVCIPLGNLHRKQISRVLKGGN